MVSKRVNQQLGGFKWAIDIDADLYTGVIVRFVGTLLSLMLTSHVYADILIDRFLVNGYCLVCSPRTVLKARSTTPTGVDFPSFSSQYAVKKNIIPESLIINTWGFKQMDRELLIFYKKHGIPLEDGDRLSGTQTMPSANVHRSQPMNSCVQMIAKYRKHNHSEANRIKSIQARSNQHEDQLEAA